jgi:hypothetical protein
VMAGARLENITNFANKVVSPLGKNKRVI